MRDERQQPISAQEASADPRASAVTPTGTLLRRQCPHCRRRETIEGEDGRPWPPYLRWPVIVTALLAAVAALATVASISALRPGTLPATGPAPEAAVAAATRATGLDFALIVVYAVALGLLGGRVLRSRRNRRPVLSIGWLPILLPVAAGLADAAENCAFVVLLHETTPGDGLRAAMSLMSVLKWGLLGLYLIPLGVATWRRIHDPDDQRDAAPVELADVLACERHALGLAGRGAIGLALSGGGIRSATFSLGVLRGLAQARLLAGIDYLSCVSGGGYIGAWLSKWAHVEGDIARVEEALGGAQEPPQVRFLRRYSNYLTPRLGIFSADAWTTLATYLRNLLLNQVVLVSTIALVILLPWLLLGALALADRLLSASPAIPPLAWLLDVLTRRAAESAKTPAAAYWALLLSALLAAAVGVVYMALALSALSSQGRRAHDDPRSPSAANTPRWTRQAGLQRRIVLPLAIASLTAAVAMSRAPRAILAQLAPGDGSTAGAESVAWIGFATVAYVLSWIAAAAISRGAHGRRNFDARWWARIVGWAIPTGLVSAAGLYLLRQLLAAAAPLPALVWGPGGVLALFTLVGALHVGLAGRRFGTEPREWMARLGAWVLIYGVGWTATLAVIVYGPPLLLSLGVVGQSAVTLGWLASTLTALLAGRSGAAEKSRPRALELGLRVAPHIFLLGLLIAVSLGSAAGLVALGRAFDSAPRTPIVETAWQSLWTAPSPPAIRTLDTTHRLLAADQPTVTFETAVAARGPGASFGDIFRQRNAGFQHLLTHQAASAIPPALWIALALIAITTSRRVDVNAFSMHHYYRDRLVRCYLGASTVGREQDVEQFTAMNHRDDLSLARLQPQAAGAGSSDPRPSDCLAAVSGNPSARQPLLLVNTALNLVAGGELAWQSRKAASFVLTPFYSGFTLGPAIGKPVSSHRPTRSFAASDPASRRPGTAGGITLGTAMAISGAAASPNAGYHTSSALAALATVFNVRLGWWVGNPARPESWRRPGPRFGLRYLLQELLALTSERTRYLYLSDGGHFENLGIYELVRRRCRTIVACDGGCDRDTSFEDLANAVRKCRIDLGVEITIDVAPIRKRQRPWALGTVHYPPATRASEGDGGGRVGPSTGTLVYLKTSLGEDRREPIDVLHYAQTHAPFPQQSTADQFFDEAQFESYRRLGELTAESVLTHLPTASGGSADAHERWRALVSALERHDGAGEAAATQDRG